MKIVFLEEGADLDALSSAYGILLLFPDAYLFKPRYLSRKASEVFKLFKDKFRTVEELPQEFDLILTDHHDVETYKRLYNGRIREIYVYDHHPKNVEGVKGKMEGVGSATTLVVEELIKHNRDIDSESATLLALGIYEDTGFLTYEGTTPRDLEALKWLLERGASLRLIRQVLHETFSKDTIDFLSKHLVSIETLFLEGRTITIVVIRAEEYEPNVLQLVYDLREVKNSEAFFVIVNSGTKTYLFGRSLKGVFDVSKVLQALGGGGHEFASAIKLEGVSVERLRSLLTSLLKGEKVKLNIKDVMTSPPFVLHKGISVEQAIKELSQRGFAGCPVIDDSGKLVGVVFKKDLLKVPKKFSQEPIERFMITEFHALKESDLIWKAEEILSKFGEKLIPVVNEEGVPIGVVTRVDIIQTMRSQHTQLLRHEKKVRIPQNIIPIAKEVGEIAKSFGYKAYLIGGVVRDILLGRNIYDVDFVIEGDAIQVGQELARRHGVSLHPFPEFSTAHLKIGDLKIELATTRRETYPHPGAYPSVEYASLREDIIRRDFTINAMAISVNEEDFGTLIDYFGGYKDLKDKLIRVLHPLSFVEDPVRILRALRFAGRLGFKLSKGTEKLLKQALPFIKSAPRGRILNELKLAFMEEKTLEILELYKKYHVLEHIIPDFAWSAELEDRILKLKQVINWHTIAFPHEKIDYGWLYLIALLLKSQIGDEILSSMSAPGWVRDSYNTLKQSFHKMKEELRKAERNSRIYEILKGKPLPILLFLMTCEELRDKVKLYMEKLRYVKVDVEKFKHLKGKELGKAIEEEKKKVMDAL